MNLTLTRSQMLARWRLHRGYEIPHYDANITRTDGIDLDDILAAEMDAWYDNLLLTAPPCYLSPVEKTRTMPVPTGGREMRLLLGESAVRVICVRLTTWRSAATVVTDPSSPLALSQRHPYTRASRNAPVAVFDPIGKTLDLYPYDPVLDNLVTLTVVERVADRYTFDSSALSLISQSTSL